MNRGLKLICETFDENTLSTHRQPNRDSFNLSVDLDHHIHDTTIRRIA